MRICGHCHKENHGDSTYCVHCGNWLGTIPERKSFRDRIEERFPLIGKVLRSETGYLALLLGGIVLLVLLSVGMAVAEGVASALLLVIGVFVFRS